MTKVLLVLGSVREGRIADKILEQVEARFAEKDGFEISVADFKKTPLPFFDDPNPPASDDFAPTNENVKAWIAQVEAADQVVIISSENNHSYPAVLKNAIDWASKAWNGKSVALIGYGWSGGSRATTELTTLLTSFIKADVNEIEANLTFMSDIDLTGAAINDTAADKIDMLIDALSPAKVAA